MSRMTSAGEAASSTSTKRNAHPSACRRLPSSLARLVLPMRRWPASKTCVPPRTFASSSRNSTSRLRSSRPLPQGQLVDSAQGSHCGLCVGENNRASTVPLSTDLLTPCRRRRTMRAAHGASPSKSMEPPASVTTLPRKSGAWRHSRSLERSNSASRLGPTPPSLQGTIRRWLRLVPWKARYATKEPLAMIFLPKTCLLAQWCAPAPERVAPRAPAGAPQPEAPPPRPAGCVRRLRALLRRASQAVRDRRKSGCPRSNAANAVLFSWIAGDVKR